MKQSFQTIAYPDLRHQKALVEDLFHKFGFIALEDVPGFVRAYQALIESAKHFVALPEEKRSLYSPFDKYTRGWSFGIEGFEEIIDSYKGSYYATVPEEWALSPNIWPSDASFRAAYVKLASIIYSCGETVLSLMSLPSTDLLGLGRLIYYGPVEKPDSTPYWCGTHRDHGLLTGLCPGVIFKEGVRVPHPPGSGLFVQGQGINISPETLIIQVGEASELFSNGKIKATKHEVRKAYGGYERYAFALFFDPPPSTIIDSTISTYNDRYTPGMRYAEWSKATYMKYNQA